MLDFGEELTIETYKIPWLIWIQILVLLLLLILLYFFGVLALDLSDNDNDNDNNRTRTRTRTRTKSTASPSSCSASHDSSSVKPETSLKLNNTTVTNRFRVQPTQVGGENGSIKGEIAAASTSRRRIVTSSAAAGGGEDGNREVIEGLESPSSPSSSTSPFTDGIISLHPCNYLRLARLAFLKCFGLDSTSDHSSNPQRRKDR